MRILIAAGLVAATCTGAEAQFMGGLADGMANAGRLENERRALDLDARDGGRRFDRLRTQHELDDIRTELRRNRELLEQFQTDRLIRGR
jgi:hypothetical protein